MNKILFTILALIISYTAAAQKAMITFKDETGKSVKIDPASLKQISLKAIGHDTKEHLYSGAMLSDIIEKAGVALGEPSKRKTIASYVVIKAKDNYQCVYALAELDALFSPNKVILANKVDGKPLSAENGPFQVIAPAEKKHGRWIRQVVSIELRVINN